MKGKKIFNLLLFSVIIIFISLLSTSFINGQARVSESMRGFIAPKVDNISLSNSQIDAFWENVSTYQNITEYDVGGYVKFANNQTHLFSLFVTAIDRQWVSIEFEPDVSACMKNLNDGWTFYIDQGTSAVTAKDVSFVGTVIPSDDSNNDLSFESVVSGDQIFIEIARQFDTQDTEGYDIIYQNGSINTVKFASSGLANHFGNHEIYFVMVTDKTLSDGQGGAIIPPDIPQVIDLSQLKFIIIGVTPIGIFGFIFLHLIRRVITSPIHHNYNRIASNSFKPPTLKERWNQTFSSKK